MRYKKGLKVITYIELAIYLLLYVSVILHYLGVSTDFVIRILSYFLAIMFCIESYYPRCKEKWIVGTTGVGSQYITLFLITIFLIPSITLLKRFFPLTTILIFITLAIYFLLYCGFLMYFLFRKSLGFKEYIINYKLKFRRIIIHSLFCGALIALSAILQYLKMKEIGM